MAGGSAFGSANQIVSGTLTAGSEASGLGITQLQTDQGSSSTAWQTIAGTTSSWMLIDTAWSASVWRAFGLFRTNLTSAATWRVRVGNALAGGQITTPYTYDSGSINAVVVAGYLQTVLVPSADYTGTYCQIDIADFSNPDGFLNIPLAFAGPTWIPTTAVTWSSSQSHNHQTDDLRTKGGQRYMTPRYVERVYSIAMDRVTDAEVWSDLDALDRLGRLGGNVLFVPDRAAASINQQAVFGILSPTGAITYAGSSINKRGWTATMAERL